MPLNPNIPLQNMQGFQQGIQNGLNFQQNQRQNRLMDLQQAELMQGALKQNNLAKLAQQAYQQKPVYEDYQMGEGQLFPGEEPIQGLKTQTGTKGEFDLPSYRDNLLRYGYADEASKVNKMIGEGPGKDRFKNAKDLRKEFTAITDDFAAQTDAYGRIQAAANNPSPAGDMALIFNYMKLLDPGSVVRESEFQLAGDSGSLPQRVQTAYNRVKTGERLAPSLRKDFVSRAKALHTQAKSGYNKRVDEYTRLSKRFDVEPEDVIFNRAVTEDRELDLGETQADGSSTWTEGGYEYRELPDGTIQRRKL